MERSSAPLEQAWNQVCATLRSEVGEQAFGSYLAQASLRRRADGAPVVVTSTGYARDWLRKNALRRMGEVWSLHDPEQRRLELKSKMEFEAETAEELLPEPVKVVVETSEPQALEVRVPSGLRGLSLQERLTFDSFVEGQANRFAFDTAQRVAAWEPGYFNPVLIHGPWGQGKTHLLTAIAWAAQRAAPEKTVIYLTAERFLNGFMQALKDRSTSAFKEELRGADLLLIDDVHFVGGKPSTQEELFHTLTWLMEEGRRVVLSADRSPAELVEVDPRLRSHLCAGLVCGVQTPDRAL
ncbi:MAG TPA: DnaA/Hda family protein, partial [Myxococcaceae bacterium]|nr:DnaA/Hda family protein [Myxococcaceae bacterium]